MMQITDASQNQCLRRHLLVAPTKVVTAAHCMVGETTSSVRVVGGRTYLNGTNGTVSRVSKIWINPDYTDATNGDGVAVLTLVDVDAVHHGQVRLLQPDERVRGRHLAPHPRLGAPPRRMAAPPISCGPATVPVVSGLQLPFSYGWTSSSPTWCALGYTSGGVDTSAGAERRSPAHRGRPGRDHFLGRGCAEAGCRCLHPAGPYSSDLVTAQVNSLTRKTSRAPLG